MKFSFSRVLLFSFVGIIVIVGLAFYAGVITKQSLDDGKTDDGSNRFVIDSNTEEVAENKGKSPSQPDIKVDYAKEEWGTNGGDLYNRRFSELNQINLDSIGDLKPEWVTSLGASLDMKFSGEATPIVVDGVMYIASGEDDVLALDAVTGEKIWEYRPEIEQKLDTVCCGWTTRGVAVGDGKVYVGLLDARLVALDQKTGEVLWETEVADWEEGYTITSAPLYYNGKVYTGVAGGEYGIRGRIMAYDAEYGHEIWRWNSIPSPYEVNGDTWPDDEDKNWLHGGAPIWNTPAVDPELGYIYFVTGNTSPDLDGSKREGDNLYANSIVALNAETGEYVWHFQEVHHDIWDMDPTNPVVLFDVEIDGKQRKALGEAGKTGWIYFLDRETGEPLIGIEEKEVPQLEEQKTSPTQPFPVGDSFVPQEITEEDIARDLGDEFEGTVGSIYTPFWDEPITLKPAPSGGANWPPSAYSPETEYFYVLGSDGYIALTREAEEEGKYEEGSSWMGSLFVTVTDAPVRGTITAMDVKTNKIAWQVDWDTSAYSGVLATAGDLIFVGHNDGRLIAFNAKTGEEVWSYKMDAGANAPTVTYEVDGEQYISIFAAGNSLEGTPHGDKVYTFKLNGSWDGTPIDASEKSSGEKITTSAEPTEPDITGDTSDPYEVGISVFEGNCLSCHGNLGANGHNGPNLQQSKVAENYDEIVQRVTNGGTSMPAFGEILSDEEIKEVARYVNEVLTKADE